VWDRFVLLAALSHHALSGIPGATLDCVAAVMWGRALNGACVQIGRAPWQMDRAAGEVWSGWQAVGRQGNALVYLLSVIR